MARARRTAGTPRRVVIPEELRAFNPADWLEPDDFEVADTGPFAVGLRAYGRYRDARHAFAAEHGLDLVDLRRPRAEVVDRPEIRTRRGGSPR